MTNIIPLHQHSPIILAGFKCPACGKVTDPLVYEYQHRTYCRKCDSWHDVQSGDYQYIIDFEEYQKWVKQRWGD